MKVVLVFACLAAVSIFVTAACVANGCEYWQVFMVNCMVGALLGLITGAKS